MRIIAFVLGSPVIERVLRHVGEPAEPLAILPAQSPFKGEVAFDQDGGRDDWPEMDQSVGTTVALEIEHRIEMNKRRETARSDR